MAGAEVAHANGRVAVYWDAAGCTSWCGVLQAPRSESTSKPATKGGARLDPFDPLPPLNPPNSGNPALGLFRRQLGARSHHCLEGRSLCFALPFASSAKPFASFALRIAATRVGGDASPRPGAKKQRAQRENRTTDPGRALARRTRHVVHLEYPVRVDCSCAAFCRLRPSHVGVQHHR